MMASASIVIPLLALVTSPLFALRPRGTLGTPSKGVGRGRAAAGPGPETATDTPPGGFVTESVAGLGPRSRSRSRSPRQVDTDTVETAGHQDGQAKEEDTKEQTNGRGECSLTLLSGKIVTVPLTKARTVAELKMILEIEHFQRRIAEHKDAETWSTVSLQLILGDSLLPDDTLLTADVCAKGLTVALPSIPGGALVPHKNAEGLWYTDPDFALDKVREWLDSGRPTRWSSYGSIPESEKPAVEACLRRLKVGLLGLIQADYRNPSSTPLEPSEDCYAGPAADKTTFCWSVYMSVRPYEHRFTGWMLELLLSLEVDNSGKREYYVSMVQPCDQFICSPLRPSCRKWHEELQIETNYGEYPDYQQRFGPFQIAECPSEDQAIAERDLMQFVQSFLAANGFSLMESSASTISVRPTSKLHGQYPMDERLIRMFWRTAYLRQHRAIEFDLESWFQEKQGRCRNRNGSEPKDPLPEPEPE